MRNTLLSALVMLSISSATHAATAVNLQVQHPWSRPAAAGTNGAGFMTLTNGGKRPDRLLSIASPLAKRVEMHQTSMQGGVMSMRRLDAGLPLGPGESVSFAPGGYHLMLVGLTKPLRAGDKVPATLVFTSGARLQITFPVLNAVPSGTSRDHMVHH